MRVEYISSSSPLPIRAPDLVAGGLLAAVLLASVPAVSQQQVSDDARSATAAQTTADEVAPSGFFTEMMDVRVINVEVFVSDRSGVPVVGLEPEDFALEVDGTVMPISNFYARAGARTRELGGSVESRDDPSFRPVEKVRTEVPERSYAVILIDHTRLSAGNKRRAFAALREAMRRISDEDLVAVVGVEGSLVFYSDFLYDRQAIDRILDHAARVSLQTDRNEFERRQIFGELARGQSGGIMGRTSLADEQQLLSRIRAYAAEEYSRCLSSLRQIERVASTLAGVPGRKTLLYVGEGIPTRPGEGLFVEWRNRFGGGNPQAEIGIRRFDFDTDYSRAVGRYDLTVPVEGLATAVNRAGVTLYGVDAEGDHGGEIRSALTEQGATSETLSVVDENYREPLEFASKATGGRFLRSSGRLTDELVGVVGDLDNYYSLGFTAPDEWQPGSDHDIEVKIEGKGFLVRHREVVRLPGRDELEAGATVAALRYQTADNPLGIRAVPGTATPRDDGALVLSMILEIPVESLALLPQDGTHAAAVAIYVSTKGQDGDSSPVQKMPFNLAIPDDKLEEAKAEAAHYPLPVVLRSGDQQVAIGVRDEVSGQFSAVRVDVSHLSP